MSQLIYVPTDRQHYMETMHAAKQVCLEIGVPIVCKSGTPTRNHYPNSRIRYHYPMPYDALRLSPYVAIVEACPFHATNEGFGRGKCRPIAHFVATEELYHTLITLSINNLISQMTTNQRKQLETSLQILTDLLARDATTADVVDLLASPITDWDDPRRNYTSMIHSIIGQLIYSSSSHHHPNDPLARLAHDLRSISVKLQPNEIEDFHRLIVHTALHQGIAIPPFRG